MEDRLIADRIFELLDQTNMEQQEFAKLVGVSDDTASNWRRYKSASFTKYIPQIASVLETTVDYLLTGQKEKPAPQNEGGLDDELSWLLDDLTPEERKQVTAFVAGLKAGREAPASDHK